LPEIVVFPLLLSGDLRTLRGRGGNFGGFSGLGGLPGRSLSRWGFPFLWEGTALCGILERKLSIRIVEEGGTRYHFSEPCKISLFMQLYFTRSGAAAGQRQNYEAATGNIRYVTLNKP